MKKVLKIISVVILSAIISCISVIGYIVFQLETSINDVLSQEQQEWLYSSIEDTKPLPDNFYATLEKYYPDYFETDFWEYNFKRLVNEDTRPHYQCNEIYLPFIPGEKLAKPETFPFNFSISFKDPVMKLEIEKKFTQKECYAFSMSITGFGSNLKGVKKAANYYYNKSLEELTEREILELNLIRQASTRFNPIFNKERLDLAVDKIMNSKK